MLSSKLVQSFVHCRRHPRERNITARAVETIETSVSKSGPPVCVGVIVLIILWYVWEAVFVSRKASERIDDCDNSIVMVNYKRRVIIHLLLLYISRAIVHDKDYRGSWWAFRETPTTIAMRINTRKK